jgi:hypothetical protein
MNQLLVLLSAAVIGFFVTGKAVSGFPSPNTPPVFDFKREWLLPENEPVGE